MEEATKLLPATSSNSRVERTDKTQERPDGISHAPVFRPKDGDPYVRFGNAHAVDQRGGQFMKWTSVVANPVVAAATPKRWFDSDDTAAKSLGAKVSAEAIVKLLSEQNLALLHLIASGRFASISELATQTHRAVSNLSRTLRKLHEGPGKSIVPRLTAGA
jgi:hypothetical protein